MMCNGIIHLQNENKQRKEKKVLNNPQTALITSNSLMPSFVSEFKITNCETKPKCELKTYSSFFKKNEFTICETTTGNSSDKNSTKSLRKTTSTENITKEQNDRFNNVLKDIYTLSKYKRFVF